MKRPPGERVPLARAAVSTFGTNLLVAFLSFVNVLITARALGVEGRGSLAFLMTFATLSSQLTSFGVEEASANIAGMWPDRRPALATNAVLLSIVFGAAAMVVLATLIAFVPAVGGGTAPELRLVALGSIPVLTLQFYLLFLVRADYGFTATNLVSLAGPLLNLLVNSLFAALGIISVGTAITTWIAGQVLATCVLAWYIATRLAGFGRPDLPLARESVIFGLKAHIARVMKTGNYRLDQWFLGSIAGPRELGLYSVAVAWTEALFFVPEALATVLRPDLVRANKRQAGISAALVFRIALLITLPAVIILIVAAPILCVTLFGSEFRGSIADLRVLALGAFGIIALKLLANALVAQRRPMLSTAAVAVAFAATIGLDLLLIPRYGGFGAALASTAAYTAGGLVAAMIFIRALDVPRSAMVPRVVDVRELIVRAGTVFERLVSRRGTA